MAFKGFAFKLVSFEEVPAFNPGYDDNVVPALYTAFREAIGALDGVIFVTPEYNLPSNTLLRLDYVMAEELKNDLLRTRFE